MNQTLIPQALLPLVDLVRQFLSFFQYLLGGVFGVYLLLVFLRWKEAREVKQYLIKISDQLAMLQKTLEQQSRKQQKHQQNKKENKIH